MNKSFSFNKLNKIGQNKSKKIAEIYDNALKEIQNIVGTSGDIEIQYFNNISKQKLEEACFYTKKAMATQTENQE